jgi:hypothetical protein
LSKGTGFTLPELVEGVGVVHAVLALAGADLGDDIQSALWSERKVRHEADVSIFTANA